MIDKKIYEFNNLDEFINNIKELKIDIITYNKFNGKSMDKYEVLNIPSSFDIETTSTYINNEKFAFMYIWQFCITINYTDYVIYGRTWEEFKKLVAELKYLYKLNKFKQLYIYVHNLSYEFQFLMKRFNFIDVFAVDNRKPLYALTEDGLMFKCSYILSNKPLFKLGEDLLKYKINKMVGDLDYNLIRTKKTKLTEKELKYCINDVRVVCHYIKEQIEIENNDITKIPLTSTGYVRRYLYNKCYNEENKKEYTKIMKSLTVTSEEYIKFLKPAFQGGFTHCNAINEGIIHSNVKSFDFTSSYPACMFFQYPMSKGKIIKINNINNFFSYINNYCCIFEITFKNIKLKENSPDAIISFSKCSKIYNYILDNGRIREAEILKTTITNIDFENICKFYNFDFYVDELIYYRKGYLPKVIIESVIEFYRDKTTLKDVEGQEFNYQLKKALLNSLFGCCVMDIVREQNCFNNEWYKDKSKTIEEQIDEYNNSRKRTISYPWGVFITAYARRNLFTGILECGNDYIYSDTDSIKILNYEKHLNYINKYNEWITEEIKKCLKFHNLDLNSCTPKTVKGIEKPLGVWDDDGTYKRFKALRAKAYLVENNEGKIKTTIAGLNKKSGVDFLLKQQKEKNIDPFITFNNNMEVNENETGKKCHTYIDEYTSGLITDYQGNESIEEEFSFIHLENTPFSLNLSKEYLELLIGLKQVEN